MISKCLGYSFMDVILSSFSSSDIHSSIYKYILKGSPATVVYTSIYEGFVYGKIPERKSRRGSPRNEI
jgi:hypothetical protein